LPSISIPQCLRVAAGAALCAGVSTTLSAQSTATPLRTRPTEKFAVSNGNRDWGPASVAGNLIIAGGPSGAAGLHAVDMTTGKLRWSYRPTDINGSVSTPPAIVRDLAIAPYGAANPGAVIAVSLTTGKPVWRGPDPATNAAVVASSDMVFVPTKDGSFVALDAATGKEIWRLAFSRRRFCVSRPIVLDGVVYVSGGVDAVAGDASRPEGIDLIALDAKTGQQRWRARADAEYGTAGVCLTTPIATATTIYGAAEARLYAFDRTTGRAKWKPVETQVMSDGRLRGTAVAALTDAGNVLVGVAETAVMGFDKNSGKSLWTVPGTFNLSSPSIAVAGNVLYVQGSVASSPAASARGTLNAIDLDSRTVLWSFSRVTAEQNWSFGFVTPVSDGLWVDSYKALVKLVP
jgi:outer membrane protein assembly factor BamB